MYFGILNKAWQNTQISACFAKLLFKSNFTLCFIPVIRNQVSNFTQNGDALTTEWVRGYWTKLTTSSVQLRTNNPRVGFSISPSMAFMYCIFFELICVKKVNESWGESVLVMKKNEKWGNEWVECVYKYYWQCNIERD